MDHLINKVDWNSIRTPFAVAGAYSFGKTAERAGQAIKTVQRAISRLKDQCGNAQSDRETGAVHLKPAGTWLANHPGLGWPDQIEQEFSKQYPSACFEGFTARQ